jgi:hypothetical protein
MDESCSKACEMQKPLTVVINRMCDLSSSKGNLDATVRLGSESHTKAFLDPTGISISSFFTFGITNLLPILLCLNRT